MSKIQDIASSIIATQVRELLDHGFPAEDLIHALEVGVKTMKHMNDRPGGIAASIAEADAISEQADDLTAAELETKLDEFFKSMGFQVKMKIDENGQPLCVCPKCVARRERADKGNSV